VIDVVWSLVDVLRGESKNLMTEEKERESQPEG